MPVNFLLPIWGGFPGEPPGRAAAAPFSRDVATTIVDAQLAFLVSRRAVLQTDADMSHFGEEHVQAAQRFEDARAQIKLDMPLLANLKAKSSEPLEGLDARVKDSLDGIEAIKDAIKITNSDPSSGLFDETVSSPSQISAVFKGGRQRHAAAAPSPRDVATATVSAQQALLASKAKLDGFTKMKVEFDKVVNAKLCAEAASEEKEPSLQVKIEDFQKVIEPWMTNIIAAKGVSAEMQEQTKRVSERREAESADFQRVVGNQPMKQIILQKAITRMEQLHSLRQERDITLHQMEPEKTAGGRDGVPRLLHREG